MRVVSPLSNLSDVLSQVKSSAARYAITLSKNEAATRAVLIDPILRALGWDTANTSMVEVEKTLLQTRADYALYDINGDVKVVVEAKQLGDNLNQQSVVLSWVNYAFRFGIQVAQVNKSMVEGMTASGRSFAALAHFDDDRALWGEMKTAIERHDFLDRRLTEHDPIVSFEITFDPKPTRVTVLFLERQDGVHRPEINLAR